LALIGLSLCEAASRLNSWSLTLLLLTLITGVSGSLSIGAASPLLMAGLVTAGCQAYFAWRLAFDKQVFATWARLRDDECPEAQYAFDRILGVLLKKNTPAGNNRSMFNRVLGARRLHLLQIIALFGQALTLLILIICLLRIPNHA
jgi:hypothetical protein